MSLRAKLLVAIVVVNLVVLGVLTWLLYAQRQSFLQKADQSFESSFEAEMPGLLRRFVERSAGSRLTIDRVLDSGNFGILCEDVMIVDKRRFSDEGSYLQFNPLGAWNRDIEFFPRDEILESIEVSMRDATTERVAGGLCMPIQSLEGETVGGLWFLPHALPEPQLPINLLLITLGVAVVALGAFLYFGIDRWVLEPLGRLGSTARAFEDGKLEDVPDARNAAPEMQRVMRAFERAGKQISRHQEELAQAVDDATARARRRERELVLSQRLAAIGTLAAGISHEINNPLAAMMNAVGRMQRNPRPEDEKWIELLDEGLGRIGRIVRRTLDFAPRTHTPLPFRIAEAVERARALVAHRLEQQDVDFLVEDQSGVDDLVLGDSHEMSQVFLNLFLNSLDAFEDRRKSTPHASAAMDRAADRIHVTISRTTDEDGRSLLRTLVEDNGPGASEETLQRIFDPFYSTKGATAQTESISSGLGMSISYSIVEQHGGLLRARSNEGAGFTAEIDLPVREEDASHTS